jgi:16S rRNA (adenine1518-N6/adenine1519-N6)-dimethyltransferase
MEKLDIKNLLKSLDIKANKFLGQNFLIDQKVVEDMIEAADLKGSETVLEVGPGLGILTEEIARKKCKVLAMEKDKNLIPYLTDKFKNNKNIEIKSGDILREKISFKNYKIIANLPFYLTSHFLRVFLEYANKPSVMVLLMQKEVAERIVAHDKNKSILSVSCELYSEPKIIRQVPSKAFYPRPEVDCAIVKFEVFRKPKYEIKDLKLFFKIVKAGFSARRKQIHNNISSGLLISSKDTKKILEKAKINPTRRAQTLSLEEWHKLYKAVGDGGIKCFKTTIRDDKLSEMKLV